jgi:hypothetical protein
MASKLMSVEVPSSLTTTSHVDERPFSLRYATL